MIPDNELIEEVVDYIYENHAEAVALLADREMERRAAIAVARARLYGFQEEASVMAYASLMFLAGPNFDQQPAIQAALTASDLGPDDRMKRLMTVTKPEDWDAAEALSDPGAWD